MPRAQEPPAPDLSKTFRKPQFPANRQNLVRREHPIPRWGDYSPTTGIYIWQKERFSGGVSSAHISRIETALAGMWYGVENHPRCNHCERADRSCTMAINDVHGTMACARCRLNPDPGCSFANFGKTTPSTAACQQSAGLSYAIRPRPNAIGRPTNNRDDDEATEDSDDEPLAKRRKRTITDDRSRRAGGKSDCQPPASKNRYFGPRRRFVVEDDSDDEISTKTTLKRHVTKDGHDVDVSGVKPCEIPDSHSPSPLFCTPSKRLSVEDFIIPPSYQKVDGGLSRSGTGEHRGMGGHRSRGGPNSMYGGFDECMPSTVTSVNADGPPVNAPKGPKAMREGGLPNNGVHGRSGYPRGGRNLHHTTTLEADQGHPVEAPSTAVSATGYVQVEERLRILEAEKREDRERVLQLEAQIDLIKKQQDLKLHELKKQMNYAINQTLMQ
jgi:hypothetical protein